MVLESDRTERSEPDRDRGPPIVFDVMSELLTLLLGGG